MKKVNSFLDRMPGKKDFQVMREAKSYYVDKTGFLALLLTKRKDRHFLFVRPECLGKTLFLSMAYAFLSPPPTASRAYLFKGLEIFHDGKAMSDCFGSIPSIFFPLNGIKGHNFQEFCTLLAARIRDVLVSMELLDTMEIPRYAAFHRRVLDGCSAPEHLMDALPFLCGILQGMTRKQAALLIDDWDAPLSLEACAFRSNEENAMVSAFMQEFLRRGLYGNPHEQLVIATGSPEQKWSGIIRDAGEICISDGTEADIFSKAMGLSGQEIMDVAEAFGFPEDGDRLLNYLPTTKQTGLCDTYYPATVLDFLRARKG